MTLPTQSKVEIPLLEELDKAGGSLPVKEAVKRVTSHFPQITRNDLTDKLSSGAFRWTNRVRWARQNLVVNGEMDKSTPGTWAITAAGRERLKTYRSGVTVPQKRKPARKKASAGSGRREKQSEAKSINHDEVARALEKIGKAFGFDTEWKPKVNLLRPDGRAFKSKRKTLDVAWQIANLAWVPIEVQVGGSVPDLIYRFQQVHQWSLRLIVVTVPHFRDEIKEAIRDYPFRDKVVVLAPDEVLAATRSLDRLLKLRATIFEL